MLFSTGLPRKHGEFSISRGQATPKRNLTPMAAGLSCSAAIAWRGSRSPRRGKANRGGSGRPGRARTARFRLHRHPDRCGWRTGRAHPHRAARPRPAFRPRVIWPGLAHPTFRRRRVRYPAPAARHLTLVPRRQYAAGALPPRQGLSSCIGEKSRPETSVGMAKAVSASLRMEKPYRPCASRPTEQLRRSRMPRGNQSESAYCPRESGHMKSSSYEYLGELCALSASLLSLSSVLQR